ncbi:MAG: HDOD domain-containing protein [Desulfobulbaceae bacterium]|nr:HDOD domain-containing protein [Desulfobulbaceae bacterium]
MPSARKLVNQFNDMKTLPHVAIRLTKMISSESTTMQDFEEVIKLDPILVVRLLKLVNSPFFGLANKVDSIAKAVVFIGMKNLRNLVAVEAIRDLYNNKSEDQGFSRQTLWMHSATVAILARMIGQRIFALDDEDIFLAGIIHDIGLIVEDQLVGEELRQVCTMVNQGGKSLVECEDAVIGTNHPKIGGLLCREWKLSEEVLLAVKHHSGSTKEFPIPSITSILHIAEYLSCKMKYGPLPGYQISLPSYLVPHIKKMMSEYKILVKALPEEMEKAKELYDPAA